jgi:hypothetical protein
MKRQGVIGQTAAQLERRLKELDSAKRILDKQEMDTRAAYYDLLVSDAVRSGFLNESEWTINVTTSDKIYLVSHENCHKKMIDKLGPVFRGWNHATVKLGGGVELDINDGELALRETREYWTDPKRKCSTFLIKFAQDNKLRIVTGDRSDQEERELRDKLASLEKVKELAKSIGGVKP